MARSSSSTIGTWLLLTWFSGCSSAALAQSPAPGAQAQTSLPPVAAHEDADAPSLPDLDTLLAGDEEYLVSERCLSLHKLHQVKVLDEQHVVFELRGKRYLLAQMENRCPGLHKDGAIAYVHRSQRLCEKDSIRGVPLTGGFTPNCQLPAFLKVSQEQLALLREALKAKHRQRKF